VIALTTLPSTEMFGAFVTTVHLVPLKCSRISRTWVLPNASTSATVHQLCASLGIIAPAETS
jgi:hypothetical protein